MKLINFCLHVSVLLCADFTLGLPENLNAFIQKLEADKLSLQGGAIAIISQGRLVYQSTFGYQVGDQGPVKADTLFPLASVSKAVSALSLGLLHKNGQINLEQPFQPAYFHQPIQLRQVLSHSTGYAFTGNREIEKGMERNEILLGLKKQKPACLPGNCFKYSNILYSIVEEGLHEQGKSLPLAIELLKKQLHLNRLSFYPKAPYVNVAYPHQEKGKPAGFPTYYPITAPAAGGIFASLEDMIKVLQLAMGYYPRILSKDTLSLFESNQIESDDGLRWNLRWPVPKKELSSYYGLGWRIIEWKRNKQKRFIFHPGYINGISTLIGYIPDKDAGIIILLNQKSIMPLQRAMDFWKLFEAFNQNS